MSLKDLANQTLENFNPQTDNASQQEAQGLPEGEFDVVLNSIKFHVYDSGYECIALDCEVIAGDNVGQHEFININLDPDFVAKDEKGNPYKLYEKYPNLLTTNIKYISQLAFATGVTLEEDDWEDMISLGQAFNDQEAKGSQFILEVSKSQNKAKTKTYTNYVFAKYADDPFGAGNQIEVSDEDIPF
ncbi:hypothetical protein [Aerococcus sp. 1KP-2016]|uniref:hypothetical protein n=1 Tax=Aerococcus sp. 1KP-2016 TaxID=1981982 RepID=UPI000B98C8FB|nr:hypothetical protein [Aerococcus sp. 1KP-2016]OYQ68290.1 hypothetical protein B9P78_00330 [Aerococcus sp. 1KP-2016]